MHPCTHTQVHASCSHECKFVRMNGENKNSKPIPCSCTHISTCMRGLGTTKLCTRFVESTRAHTHTLASPRRNDCAHTLVFMSTHTLMHAQHMRRTLARQRNTRHGACIYVSAYQTMIQPVEFLQKKKHLSQTLDNQGWNLGASTTSNLAHTQGKPLHKEKTRTRQKTCMASQQSQ